MAAIKFLYVNLLLWKSVTIFLKDNKIFSGFRQTQQYIVIMDFNLTITMFANPTGTRWFKYDRDWFVCKQAALRSSCATLREW